MTENKAITERRDEVERDINALKPWYKDQADALLDEEYRNLAWEAVELNKPLVYKAMRGRFNRVQDSSMKEDIEQDMLFTLLAAVWNHEPSYGRFSTYAIACMHQKIGQLGSHYIRQSRNPVSIPWNYTISYADGVASNLEEARAEERISAYEYQNKKPAVTRLSLAAHQGYRRIIAKTALSGENGEKTPHDAEDFLSNLPDPHDGYSTVFLADLRECLLRALATLSDREAFVIRSRYGLDNGRSKILQEIADEMSITRERVRQIEVKSLRKLRHPSRSRPFREYREDIGMLSDA